MKNTLIAAALACLSLAGCHHIVDGYAGQGGGTLPRDVRNLIEHRELCAYYHRQDGFDFDDHREAFVSDQANLFCYNSDAELARLRKKYANRPEIQTALDKVEADIAAGM